VRISVEIEKG